MLLEGFLFYGSSYLNMLKRLVWKIEQILKQMCVEVYNFLIFS